MRKGAPWLKTILILCAWAAACKNGSHLQAQFDHLRSRRDAKRRSAPSRLDPYRRLPHAQRRHPLPRSCPRPFRSPRQNAADPAASHASAKTRICHPDHHLGGVNPDRFLSRSHVLRAPPYGSGLARHEKRPHRVFDADFERGQLRIRSEAEKNLIILCGG